MKEELAEECDYTREASFLRTFRSLEYLGDDSWFKVPWVWEGSTDRVLVMERVNGVSVGEAVINGWSQQDRDDARPSLQAPSQTKDSCYSDLRSRY
jgi:aarF domain-containing kinase